MKNLLVSLAIVMSTSISANAGDKWVGPTSPLSPMWGLSGSSIMTEALRPYPQPVPSYGQDQRVRDLEDQIDDLRRKQRNRRALADDGDE